MKKYIFILFILFTSCNLLTSRDPEKPNKSGISVVVSSTPEMLFTNLKNSFSNKFIDSYISSFSDTVFINNEFVFSPSASANIKYSVLRDWGINSERQYFINSASTYKTMELVLSDEEKNNYLDSAIYIYKYEIYLDKSEENNKVFKGIARFNINLDSRSQWVITKWADVEIDNYQSWSELKGSMY